MPLVKAKPTSPGRRFAVRVVTPGLHKGKPWGPLTEKKKRTGGRNNKGRITVRHRGGGHKRTLRIVDFRRDKDGVPAKVERLEYDPNRSAHLLLLLYADGERRYVMFNWMTSQVALDYEAGRHRFSATLKRLNPFT